MKTRPESSKDNTSPPESNQRSDIFKKIKAASILQISDMLDELTIILEGMHEEIRQRGVNFGSTNPNN